tara:strand:- start:127 stop:2376 length:2250 start_codon:yes stop_codon:yes gene_type:complete
MPLRLNAPHWTKQPVAPRTLLRIKESGDKSFNYETFGIDTLPELLLEAAINAPSPSNKSFFLLSMQNKAFRKAAPKLLAAKRRELETGVNRWLDAFMTHEDATREKHRLFSGHHAPPPAKKQEYEAIEASYDQVSFDTFVLLERFFGRDNGNWLLMTLYATLEAANKPIGLQQPARRPYDLSPFCLSDIAIAGIVFQQCTVCSSRMAAFPNANPRKKCNPFDRTFVQFRAVPIQDSSGGLFRFGNELMFCKERCLLRECVQVSGNSLAPLVQHNPNDAPGVVKQKFESEVLLDALLAEKGWTLDCHNRVTPAEEGEFTATKSMVRIALEGVPYTDTMRLVWLEPTALTAKTLAGEMELSPQQVRAAKKAATRLVRLKEQEEAAIRETRIVTLLEDVEAALQRTFGEHADWSYWAKRLPHLQATARRILFLWDPAATFEGRKDVKTPYFSSMNMTHVRSFLVNLRFLTQHLCARAEQLQMAPSIPAQEWLLGLATGRMDPTGPTGPWRTHIDSASASTRNKWCKDNRVGGGPHRLELTPDSDYLLLALHAFDSLPQRLWHLYLDVVYSDTKKRHVLEWVLRHTVTKCEISGSVVGNESYTVFYEQHKMIRDGVRALEGTTHGVVVPHHFPQSCPTLHQWKLAVGGSHTSFLQPLKDYFEETAMTLIFWPEARALGLHMLNITPSMLAGGFLQDHRALGGGCVPPAPNLHSAHPVPLRPSDYVKYVSNTGRFAYTCQGREYDPPEAQEAPR